MPRSRAPQNSASSCGQRLFSDLQAVYQKIIQTNGASFPFRAKDSRRLSHTAPRTRQPLTVANSIFSTRSPSMCDSVEEIIIKPLQFHERLAYSSCSSRSHPVAVSAFEASSHINSQFDGDSDSPHYSEPRISRIRSRSSLAAPIEYSEQSIRYVTEQVSLEQARQLKLRSCIKQHRVDRRYFVSGSKMLIQKQAFEDTHDNVLKSNSVKINTGRLRHSCRSRGSTMKNSNKNNLAINGRGVQDNTSLKDSTEASSIDGVDTVAIPTANTGKISAPDTTETINVQIKVSTNISDRHSVEDEHPMSLESASISDS